MGNTILQVFSLHHIRIAPASPPTQPPKAREEGGHCWISKKTPLSNQWPFYQKLELLQRLIVLAICYARCVSAQSSVGIMAPQLWEVCIAALGLGWLGLCIYRATLAPLSKLPGPWYSRFSDVVLMYKEFTAHRRVYIHELHKKFGPVVRLGPNEVSFTSVEALKEIYQSGGSGYDKTEFYNLFVQYGTRTTFSTLRKREVS